MCSRRLRDLLLDPVTRSLSVDVSCPIQDNEEEPVVEAETNPFRVDVPQEDFIFLPGHSILREEGAFGAESTENEAEGMLGKGPCLLWE